MKITVFGATGKTGQEVVRQALAQGYEVNALVRNPKKMDLTDEKLNLVVGDVTNVQDVEQAVDSVDGVIVALGASPNMQADLVMEQGTVNIIAAMKKHGVQRLIVMSSYAMSGTEAGKEFMRKMGMKEDQITMVQPVLDDKAKQKDAVIKSGLEYVIVEPTMLHDKGKTEQYRIGEDLDVKAGDAISRADVADFMLTSLTDNQWVGSIVTISD